MICRTRLRCSAYFTGYERNIRAEDLYSEVVVDVIDGVRAGVDVTVSAVGPSIVSTAGIPASIRNMIAGERVKRGFDCELCRSSRLGLGRR